MTEEMIGMIIIVQLEDFKAFELLSVTSSAFSSAKATISSQADAHCDRWRHQQFSRQMQSSINVLPDGSESGALTKLSAM